MRILLIAKGFVTNSSSSNYWLNDGQLEPGEPGYSTSTPNATSSANNTQNQTPSTPANSAPSSQTATETRATDTVQKTPYYQESSIQNLMIWGGFSLILVAIILIKKFKK